LKLSKNSFSPRLIKKQKKIEKIEKQVIKAEQKRIKSEANNKAKEISDNKKQEQALNAEEATRKEKEDLAKLIYDKNLVAFESIVVHEFSTTGNKLQGQNIYILNDGSMKVASVRKNKYKPTYELSNDQITKVEISISQGGSTYENTIKVTSSDGRIDVLRTINFGMTYKASIRDASKVPAILSAIYGERYAKL